MKHKATLEQRSNFPSLTCCGVILDYIMGNESALISAWPTLTRATICISQRHPRLLSLTMDMACWKRKRMGWCKVVLGVNTKLKKAEAS